MNVYPKKRRFSRILIVIVILVIGIFIYTKRQAKQSEAPDTIQVPAVMEFLSSDVITTESQTLRQVLPISGELRALNQASVKALVSGEVTEVLVREGEAVQAGQVLVKINASEYQARVSQAQGALKAAQGQWNIATQTRDNNQALLDQGFISRNAFDTASTQYEIAKANVDSAKGALDVAQKALADTTIRASISGLISSRSVQPGEKVSTDFKLLDIVDLRQMELEAPVPTSDILHVALGQEVSVTVEGLPNALKGTVVRINPATQSGSRSIMIYIRMDNPQGLLRAGMFAEAALTLSKKDDVLSIPQSAIHTENDVTYIYTIENQKIVRRVITTGMRGINSYGNAVEVVSGLSAGSIVVKSNLGALKEGTSVHLPDMQAATAKH